MCFIAVCLCVVAANVAGPSACMLNVRGMTQKQLCVIAVVTKLKEQHCADPCNTLELFVSIKHQKTDVDLSKLECCSRQVTGTAYDPELFLEQEPLMGGQPPSPPRAALDVPIPLQRSQTEHEATLTAATRQGTKQSWLCRRRSRYAEF